MAQYLHLEMTRLPERFERRKGPGFGSVVQRNPSGHGSKLKTELVSTINNKMGRRRPPSINPSLILRVKMSGGLQEDEWEKLGLNVLSSDVDKHLILFSSNQDIEDLKSRLEAYSLGTPQGQKHPKYAAFVSAIEEISEVQAEDRIGGRLKEAGYKTVSDFLGTGNLIIDLELWDLGTIQLRNEKVAEITRFIESCECDVLDTFTGPSITMMRIQVSESLIPELLSLDEISSIDLRPQTDVSTDEISAFTIDDLPEILTIEDDAPVIGVIDSGVNRHPLLDGILVGSIAVPRELGTADDNGHGTRVSGIAIYGDLKNQIDQGKLQPGARLCSAKVVDAHGCFPERKLVPGQMRDAINTLHKDYGARIFVISLGLSDQPFNDGKVGPWAATLDELTAELDVVIFVSAGNRHPRSGADLEQAVTDYPRYLTEETNRILEPASALNVVTIGSLSHGDGLDSSTVQYVENRPIALRGQPSPFTRIGPGVSGCQKPDFVDFGGTMVFDPVAGRLHDARTVPAAGVLTVHHEHFDQLFTSGSGTSYSTPLAAFKAAQILRVLPNASGNLVRALLGASSSIDKDIQSFLTPVGEKNIRKIFGNGVVDLEKAVYSNDGRVVLYTEDSLPVDHFAVFEIPIPREYQSTKGRRNIKVSLAYDPPVRHSRLDYAGIKMSFRLIRGCDSSLVFEHFRKREQSEGRFPEMPNRFNCDLKPGPDMRERSSLQVAFKSFDRVITDYGDQYYLVVRCEGRWAKETIEHQKFAVAVELSHEEEIQLYQQLRVRARV
jgi:hypothetical protein